MNDPAKDEATQILLAAVPAELWDPASSPQSTAATLHELIQDLYAIERRLPKGVNVDGDRDRYAVACAQLEQTVLTMIREFETVSIDMGYLEALAKVRAADGMQWYQGRWGASFFRPEEVRSHADSFEQAARQVGNSRVNSVRRRLDFFRKTALRKGCGVVEVQRFPYERVSRAHSADALPLSNVKGFDDSRHGLLREDVSTRDAGQLKTDNHLRLVTEISEAMHTGDAILVHAHEPITRAFGELVTARKRHPAGEVRIVYNDGSEAKAFPLGCIPQPGRDYSRGRFPLNVELISIRHPELDWSAHTAWYRNSEIGYAPNSAATDEFCYEYSKRELVDLRQAYDDTPLLLNVYHTGLEPAVVGFYRAVVEQLRDANTSNPWIVLQPRFFKGRGEFETPLSWPSRGPFSKG